MSTSAFHQSPTPQDHGLDFNYSLWTAGTVVTLCNVPWNSDYRDIVDFGSYTALDDYLTNQSGPLVQISKMTYARFGQPVKVSLPINSVLPYNYIRVFNPAQPVNGDTGRAYYYFINAVEHKATNTTAIYVQLDVWQTFGYDVKFGNCYIERGHIGIANENQFDDYGRTYLTVPEGLDVGGEYQIVRREHEEIASARNLDSQGLPNYEVMVVSTVSLTDDPGDVTNPHLVTANGSDFETLANGTDIYVMTYGDFLTYIAVMKDKPWFTQGIAGVYAIPKHTRYGGNWTQVSLPTINGNTITAWEPHYGALSTLNTPTMTNWRDSLGAFIPSRYANLKKFFTYPYMVCEVTAYTGTPVILKPESWTDDHGSVVEVPHFAPPGMRLAIVPHRYNAHGFVSQEEDQYGILNDGAEWLDVATGVFNFPSFSVVNNAAIAYMAGNAHSIAYSFQNADWSQQKSLSGNQLSYDQSTKAIDTATAQTNLGMQTNAANTQLANNTAAASATVDMLRTGAGAAESLVSGGGAGSLAGAAMGIAGNMAGLAIGTNQRNQALGISNNQAQLSNQYSNNLAGYNRDTNKQLQDWAAKGDYQNQIASINAKLQDVKLTQPSVSGQLGGDAFNLATHRMGYDVKIRMISQGVMHAIGEYWLRYGYAVQRFGTMPDSLQVMSKFTYWKLKETYITSAKCPEAFKQAIRGIFEKGVTVWNNPGDIGNIDIGTNEPLTGVTL